MGATKAAAKRPPIHMIDSEAAKLADLALQVEERLPQVAEMLLRETDRATLHRAAAMPPDVVTMGSSVTFQDEGSGARRTVRLVYPPDANIDLGRISILTPVGAGLIGLREGQSILWPDREGHERTLAILQVDQTPEAA